MKETFTTPHKSLDTTYVSPAVEVTDIMVEQNILQSGSGDLPPMDGEIW